MIKSTLDLLVLSFDGVTKETYEKIRKKANFESTFQNINYFLELKSRAKKAPYTMIQLIYQQENFNEAKEFYKKLSNNKWSPSLSNLIQFTAFRGIAEVEGMNEVLTADYNFYKPLRDKKFYLDVEVNPIKYMIANILGNFIKKSLGKTIKKD